MNMKQLQKGKWVLTHDLYRESFDLFDTRERIHYPFLKPIEMLETEYTDEYYENLLDEQVKKLIYG